MRVRAASQKWRCRISLSRGRKSYSMLRRCMVSRWRRRTAVEMRSAMSAVSLPPSSRAWSVSRRICLRAASLVGIGGVPLRDAGVEVPAVEVDALVGLEEFGEEFAGGGEGFAFEVDEADDDVGDLNAGVVDVVLHADFVAASCSCRGAGGAGRCRRGWRCGGGRCARPCWG